MTTPNNQCNVSPTNGINGIKIYGTTFIINTVTDYGPYIFAKLKASRKNHIMRHHHISMQKMTSNGHFIQPKLKLSIAKPKIQIRVPRKGHKIKTSA